MIRLLLLSLVVSIGYRGSAQEVRAFNISAAGINIGEMTVSREVRDTLTHYVMKSDVNFWFFSHVRLSYKVYSVYHNDHLISSQVTTQSNKGTFTSMVQWNKDHYVVDAQAYKYSNKEIIRGPIQTNSARMIFEEPIGKTRALADSYGVLASLDFKDNAYALDVLGKVNHYYYSKGLFKRAVVYHSVKNFEITPRPE